MKKLIMSATAMVFFATVSFAQQADQQKTTATPAATPTAATSTTSATGSTAAPAAKGEPAAAPQASPADNKKTDGQPAGTK